MQYAGPRALLRWAHTFGAAKGLWVAVGTDGPVTAVAADILRPADLTWGTNDWRDRD